ncbi:MAG: HIRAN domain-containing protein [Dehalococcoidia bacterium]
MSILRSIVGFARGEQRAAPSPSQPATPALDGGDVPPGGRFRVEIVGEAHYQDVLARLAGPKTSHGVSIYKAAMLAPEPDNPHDAKAVAVRIDGLTVGYLSREQAATFHSVMAGEKWAAQPFGPVRGWIHGGWKRPGDEGHYGVTLFLSDRSLGEALGSDDRA